MNRVDFQTLAKIRLDEAKVLLDNGKPDGAYYLAGYAVECALKACIAKRPKRHDFPVEPATLREYYTHNLEQLVKVADLKRLHEADLRSNTALKANWAIVKDWDETGRYKQWTLTEAQDLFNAISAKLDGVLAWIRRHW